MSNYSRQALIAAIGEAVQAFQEATDEVDEAAAAALGVNQTDLRCLSILWRGPTTAGALADAAGLTRGATTTALDRLEARGFARRVRDREDRRSVNVEITPAARSAIGRLYGALATEGAKLLQKYSMEALQGILRYLEQGRALQRAHAERLRAQRGPAAPASRRRQPRAAARRTGGDG